MKRIHVQLRQMLYIPVRFVYHIYALIMGAIDDYKHRNDPPLPPVPCQIYGQPGHKERYCPNARELGF